MKKLLFVSLFLTAGILVSRAQFVVTGVILDSASREPLAKASVFCQNTTLGTVSDQSGNFSLTLKSGGYDLIFTYTGYQTQTIRISENNKLEVLMVKEEKSMGEVVLKNTYEVADGWTKYGDFFTKNFIGATPFAKQCVLTNPEVLKFFYYKRSNRLKVTATDALQIANYALGYNLRYQLDSFVWHYNTSLNSYRGYCLYTEMEGNDSLKAVWTKNRKNAYEGSKLHFMRSYYDSTLVEDGWIVDLLDTKDNKKFNKIDMYDTNYYNVVAYTRDSLSFHQRDSITIDTVIHQVPTGQVEVEIFFPRKISITYTKKRPEPEYGKALGYTMSLPHIISYIDLKAPIAIMENGYYYDQRDWVGQGYWSWKNVGDLLPYDYIPD